MVTHFKKLALYLALVVVCYFLAWTLAFVFLNGPDFTFYFEYLSYFWWSSAGERPAITGMFSVVLTIPFSLVAIWVLRRSLKKNKERI